METNFLEEFYCPLGNIRSNKRKKQVENVAN